MMRMSQGLPPGPPPRRRYHPKMLLWHQTNTRPASTMFQHITASQSRTWAQHLATVKVWNTNILMCLSRPKQCRNCVWSDCNNCAKSGYVVMCNIPGQMLRLLYDALRELPVHH